VGTQRDLVEAHSFSRRRLLTAFVSGAPVGRAVEPARPGRTLVGGLALAVLLTAGAAVCDVLAQQPPAEGDHPGHSPRTARPTQPTPAPQAPQDGGRPSP
jgi:hypothetical protein